MAQVVLLKEAQEGCRKLVQLRSLHDQDTLKVRVHLTLPYMGPHHNVGIVTPRGAHFVNVFKTSAENIVEAVINGVSLVEYNSVSLSHGLLDCFNVLDLG